MGAMSSSQASAVKRRGHEAEVVFNQRFGDPNAAVNWSGSSADCMLSEARLASDFKEWLVGKDLSLDGGVSLKNGITIQIHLGNLPELTDRSTCSVTSEEDPHRWDKRRTIVKHGIPFDAQEKVLRDPNFWNKYLKKGDILCYDVPKKDPNDPPTEYRFFKMDDVISYICSSACQWRILATGRLKGDLDGKAIFTYERRKNGSFVMGAHGGKCGKKLMDILKDNIDVFVVPKVEK